MYIRNDVNYKRQIMLAETDLPNVTIEISLGKEKKTILNYFYREWTGGVTGDSNIHKTEM